MTNLPLAVLALSYSGLVLFFLAHALKKLYTPVRAAITALVISVTIHGATMLFLEADQSPTALAFWGVPHLLLAPLLLWSAWKQERSGQ